MIAAGYMAKRVEKNPEWLGVPCVQDIYSVSPCVSEAFADYVNYWQHNGYWLFDSPDIIQRLATKYAIPLNGTKLFYYEVYELQFNADEGNWESFKPEPSFPLEVEKPVAARLDGYDVVTFFAGNDPECSPLSCNSLAKEIRTNRHCLLSALEEAKDLLETGRFIECEPGPYRIFAVYSVKRSWPDD